MVKSNVPCETLIGRYKVFSVKDVLYDYNNDNLKGRGHGCDVETSRARLLMI